MSPTRCKYAVCRPISGPVTELVHHARSIPVRYPAAAAWRRHLHSGFEFWLLGSRLKEMSLTGS